MFKIGDLIDKEWLISSDNEDLEIYELIKIEKVNFHKYAGCALACDSILVIGVKKEGLNAVLQCLALFKNGINVYEIFINDFGN